MTRACSRQLHRDAAPSWGKKSMGVHFITDPSEAQPGDWVLALLDDSDQAGALGWHWQDQNDVIYGEIFARPSLDAGSTALTGPYAISSVLSHEVLETYVDPHCNLWADNGNGMLISYEACDPVEDRLYAINNVAVSDFVLPEWFDIYRSAGEQYSYLSSVPTPFTMTKGGYWVQAAISGEQQKFGAKEFVFGDDVPAWKKEYKMRDNGRNSRKVLR